MARRAFHQLLKRLNTGARPKVWRTVLDTTLVVRESSSTAVAAVGERNPSRSDPQTPRGAPPSGADERLSDQEAS